MDLGVLKNIFRTSDDEQPYKEKASVLAHRRTSKSSSHGEGGLGLMLRISSSGIVWIASVKSDGPAALQV